MALNAAERDRVRYHLGYQSVQQAASIQFGMPAATQTSFLVETAMNNIMAVAEERIRSYLNVLDGIESKLVCAQDRLAADTLEGLKLRGGEPDMLEDEYRRWAYRLADILGCPLNPFSKRFAGNVRAGNLPVR